MLLCVPVFGRLLGVCYVRLFCVLLSIWRVLLLYACVVAVPLCVSVVRLCVLFVVVFFCVCAVVVLVCAAQDFLKQPCPGNTSETNDALYVSISNFSPASLQSTWTKSCDTSPSGAYIPHLIRLFIM